MDNHGTKGCGVVRWERRLKVPLLRDFLLRQRKRSKGEGVSESPFGQINSKPNSIYVRLVIKGDANGFPC